MSSFLILDPRPVYFTSTGAVAAGGSLKFFQSGTTTPQDVYGDSDLSTNNGAVLALGTDGRTSVDVWGDGTNAYRVQLFDANGALQFDVDNVAIPGGLSIPTLVSGKVLSNDGAGLVWAAMTGVPDPTGQSGRVLSNDGTNPTWIAGINPADGNNTVLNNFILKNVRDTVQTVTAAAATALDFTQGGIVLLDQAVDTTLTIAGVQGATLTIHRIKDNTATARAITWPSSVIWPGGTAPTLTQTANAHDVFSLQYTTGPNWSGSYSLDLK